MNNTHLIYIEVMKQRLKELQSVPYHRYQFKKEKRKSGIATILRRFL